MKDKEAQEFIAEMRRCYTAGELPQWKIRRLESIPGWSWEMTVEEIQTAVDFDAVLDEPVPVVGKKPRI